MWPVSSPTISVKETVHACARGTRDKSLASRLLDARRDMESNNEDFKATIADEKTHLITQDRYAISGVSGEELKWMYARQLSRTGRPARKLYDILISAAPHGLCCYCQYGQAKTLDHFVPKDHSAGLAIDPWNLVPACEQCNHKLLARWGSSASEQMLHPYDMPVLGRWLQGEVAAYSPLRIQFSVDVLTLRDSELQDRIVNEFEALGLAEMFAVVSVGDVETTSRTLTRLFTPGNEETVREHLLEIAADAFGVDENSRRGVVLNALADDPWFCAGGYLDR
jgi:5-methylcytosine-specific restriction endonuclease McrA